MADAVIETRDLRKRFGDVAAVRGLDLRVEPGSICGFLGRNGAGKTTTMKMLLGMTRPDAGSASVLGLDAADPAASVDIRARVAFISDEKDLFNAFTVAQMIRFTSRFYPGWRRDLEERFTRQFALPLKQRVQTLSRGMRTRLALLLALSRGAEILMLDEPTSGLDPAAAEEVLQALVHQVAQNGVTVFFSSHQIAEVEQIADAIVIIDQGRRVVGGALDDLRREFQRVVIVFDGDAPAHTFTAPGVRRISRQGRVLSMLAGGNVEAVVAEARALGPVSVDVSPVTLKDVFLESVQTEAR